MNKWQIKFKRRVRKHSTVDPNIILSQNMIEGVSKTANQITTQNNTTWGRYNSHHSTTYGHRFLRDIERPRQLCPGLLADVGRGVEDGAHVGALAVGEDGARTLRRHQRVPGTAGQTWKKEKKMNLSSC